MTDPQPEPTATPAKSLRRRIIVIVAAVVAGILAYVVVMAVLGAGSSESVSFTSDEHGYSIDFPAEPRELTQTVPVGGTDIDLDSVVWEDADSALLSSAAQFPEGTIVDLDAALDGSVEGAVANIPGGVVTESEVSELDGMPARRAEATSTNGNVFLVVAFGADDTIQFQLLALGVDEATAQEFFDSFELTG